MSSAVLVLCAGILMCFSEDCMRAATGAATVFTSSVMPALFPMMVLAGMPFSAKRSEKKRGAWRMDLSATLFGFAAGSPAGTRRVAAMREAGLIGQGRAARLMITVGVMSPLFFLGTLPAWTRNAAASLVMLAAHWLSALMLGSLLRFLPCVIRPFRPFEYPAPPEASPSPEDGKRPAPFEEKHPSPALLSALPGAIASAAQALLSVCGAMMLSSIIMSVLRALLTRLFPAFTAANAGLLSMLHALLEIGGGANAVVKSFITQEDHLYALLCALCSFGGLSIWMQNLACAGQKIRPAALLLGRAVHGAMAYGVCRLLMLGLPQTVKTSVVMASAGVTAFGNPLPYLGALLMLSALAAFWQRSKTCSPHN